MRKHFYILTLSHNIYIYYEFGLEIAQDSSSSVEQLNLLIDHVETYSGSTIAI